MHLPALPRTGSAVEWELACPEVEDARLRALVDPMHTAVASLFELVGGWRRGADERWVASMLRRAGGMDLDAFALFGAEERLVPDALIPIPAKSGPPFAETLAAVASTPPQAIADDLVRALDRHEPSPQLAPWIEQPERMLGRYVDALTLWWQVVLEPEWPRMQALLETEVLRIGRLLATEGLEQTLSAVHPRIRWEDGHLTLPAAPSVSRSEVHRRTFMLVPMACGPDGIMCNPERPGMLLIAYAAKGSGALFQTDHEPRADALSEMLGTGRAAVLRALHGPRSLGVLGSEVGVTVSTVHKHLAALVRAQLVHRGRVGRHVLYARTDRGERLVSLFAAVSA